MQATQFHPLFYIVHRKELFEILLFRSRIADLFLQRERRKNITYKIWGMVFGFGIIKHWFLDLLLLLVLLQIYVTFRIFMLLKIYKWYKLYVQKLRRL